MQRWVGRYSVFSTATHYELDGSEIESQWGEGRFSAPVPTCPPYTRGIESFPGVERPRRGADHPPPSSAKIKERVELYIQGVPGGMDKTSGECSLC